jgi:1,4-dihydroxy-2-naphthoyl-CoA hydrolase
MNPPPHIRRQLPDFPRMFGMTLTLTENDRVCGELDVKQHHSNGQDVMHGGVLMAFGDTLGAIGTALNLAPGMRTTTLESKTNFIAPAPLGMRLAGEATPVHRGRQTQIWQTRITRPDGKLVAVVTQTQIVFPARPADAAAQPTAAE